MAAAFFGVVAVIDRSRFLSRFYGCYVHSSRHPLMGCWLARAREFFWLFFFRRPCFGRFFLFREYLTAAGWGCGLIIAA